MWNMTDDDGLEKSGVKTILGLSKTFSAAKNLCSLHQVCF